MPHPESQDTGESSWYSILETLSLLASFHCAVKFHAHCQGRKATSSLNQLWTVRTAWITGLTRQTNRYNSGMDVRGVIFALETDHIRHVALDEQEGNLMSTLRYWLDSSFFSRKGFVQSRNLALHDEGLTLLPCIRICLGYLFIHFIPTSCAHQQPFWYVNTYLSFVFHWVLTNMYIILIYMHET